MLRLLILTIIYVLAGTISFAQTKVPPYIIEKSLTLREASVVSAHPLASRVGTEIMQKGGNAFDAAIATQLALAVVFPNAGNIGGGGFLLAHTASGRNLTIDFRETAPAGSHRDMYLDSNGNPVPRLSLDGPLASAVPGTVAGLFATMPYARLLFQALIEPAIQLAEKGFALTSAQADSLNRYRKHFLLHNRNPTAFTAQDNWKEGDILIQPELANTLKRIQDQGQKGFYEGLTADLIVQEMKAGKGLMTHEDLKNYRVKERAALTIPYRGFEVVSIPLPSSGGIILGQLLRMMEPYDLRASGFHSAENIQRMVEAERRSFADRAWYLGDPEFTDVPVNKLLSKSYLRARMNDFKPGIAGSSQITSHGQLTESNETTHISIIDKEGNAVSITTTLNGYYGSKTMVSGAGFLLNNEMDDFSIKPGTPNLFGVTGHTANAIAPGKRMLSSMAPTIVLQNGKPVIITGTPGGSTIPTSVFQTIINLIDFQLSPQDAVNQPKFHHQWLPDRIDVEAGFPEEPVQQLIKMGYQIRHVPSLGRIELICIDNTNPIRITAVADSRGDDAAAGF